MEFLKNIALPQSAEHIQLLHYLLILILFLFIPFISALFGGASLSIYFKRLGKKTGEEKYFSLSRDVLNYIAINKSVAFILGIVPLLITILIFSQIFQSSEISNLEYLGYSLILVTASVILIYYYRTSQGSTHFFGRVSGLIGIILLFFALWLYVTGMSIAVFYSDWQPAGLLRDLFTSIVIIRFLFFIVASFTVTGGAILFAFFYLDEGRSSIDKDYAGFIKSKFVRITSTSALLLPLLMLANLILLPGGSLSGAVFAYIIVGLFLLFIALHFLYMIFARFSSKLTALLFFSILFLILTAIISDQLIISNSTKINSTVLAFNYNKILMELKEEGGPEVLNGEEIYQVRCASCHRFDIKLVGPPHNEVVPKYFGKENELLAFIKNPTKIDPNYPPMPNPGLKPNEAKAVADYILNKVKEKTGK